MFNFNHVASSSYWLRNGHKTKVENN